MAKAVSVSSEDWKYAVRIRTLQDLFNYLSRSYVSKATLPAQKVHPVEFFAKT